MKLHGRFDLLVSQIESARSGASSERALQTYIEEEDDDVVDSDEEQDWVRYSPSFHFVSIVYLTNSSINDVVPSLMEQMPSSEEGESDEDDEVDSDEEELLHADNVDGDDDDDDGDDEAMEVDDREGNEDSEGDGSGNDSD